MVQIVIDVKKYEKMTKRKFIMQYLFRKAVGNRTAGESDVSEIYSVWVELCLQIGETPGKSRGMTEELSRMRGAGIVEVTRTGKSSGPIPKNFYILTEEYFEFMKNGGDE